MPGASHVPRCPYFGSPTLIIRALCFSAGMVVATPVPAQDIIVIGASIMDWNGHASIPARLSQELGLPVDDRSVAGAQITAGPWERMHGLDIRAQLGPDRPDLLVMTGGGNDLAEACACDTGCAEAVDALLTEEGRGALGVFLQQVVTDGTRVFLLGYADPPAGGNDFSGCIPHLRTLAERAKTIPGVTLVPVRQAIDPHDTSLYDADRVHPSTKGSAVMARLLAEAIDAASRR